MIKRFDPGPINAAPERCTGRPKLAVEGPTCVSDTVISGSLIDTCLTEKIENRHRFNACEPDAEKRLGILPAA